MNSAAEGSRVALVTGGTSNIGLAIAAHFLELGWKVVVLSRGRRSALPLQDAAAGSPGELELLRADVTVYEELERVAQEVEQLFGRIDLLVNNAGGLCEQESLLETDTAWFRSVFDLNICGTFNCCRAFGGLVIRAGGKIINLSGGGATEAAPDGWNLAYTSAKAAVLRFTEALANQLKAQGVEVYAIDPGWVATPEELRELEEGEGLVDLKYLRPATDAAALIEHLLANGNTEMSGKLFSVIEDYHSIIEALRARPDPETLKLRLARGGESNSS